MKKENSKKRKINRRKITHLRNERTRLRAEGQSGSKYYSHVAAEIKQREKKK